MVVAVRRRCSSCTRSLLENNHLLEEDIYIYTFFQMHVEASVQSSPPVHSSNVVFKFVGHSER